MNKRLLRMILGLLALSVEESRPGPHKGKTV